MSSTKNTHYFLVRISCGGDDEDSFGPDRFFEVGMSERITIGGCLAKIEKISKALCQRKGWTFILCEVQGIGKVPNPVIPSMAEVLEVAGSHISFLTYS